MHNEAVSRQEKEFKQYLFRTIETFQKKRAFLIGDLFAGQDRRTAFILDSAYENLNQLYDCLIDKHFDSGGDCYDELMTGICERLGIFENSLLSCDSADNIIEAASDVISSIWHAYLELGVKPVEVKGVRS